MRLQYKRERGSEKEIEKKKFENAILESERERERKCGRMRVGERQ